MIGLTLLACLTAIGHNFFYVYLDTKQVSEVPIPQSWVIRIGTAFAFLFKASLVPAVGIAFYQRFWYSARSSALQVQSIDAMFGVLGNPLHFFNSELLLKTKALFVMAVIVWILPIAAIFSPGAMTGLCPCDFTRLMKVISAPSNQTSTSQVPILDLENDIGILQLGSASSFFGGSIGFRRFMLGVFSSGQISPWTSPCGPNCTYSVSFAGPALSCGPGDSNSQNGPTTPDNVFYNATFANDSSDFDGNGPSGLLIALKETESTQTVINCTLYNASYNINVEYYENIQTVNWEIVLDGIVPASVWEAYNNDIFQATRQPDSNGTYNGLTVAEWWFVLNEYTAGYTFFNFLQGSLQPEPDGA
jgi:hypothetical protein